jgi:hypothetical protein
VQSRLNIMAFSNEHIPQYLELHEFVTHAYVYSGVTSSNA